MTTTPTQSSPAIGGAREDLSPCPFCGFVSPKVVSNGIGDFFVRCDSGNEGRPSCGARTSDVRCETEEQAIRRWNCRPTYPTPSPASGERDAVHLASLGAAKEIAEIIADVANALFPNKPVMASQVNHSIPHFVEIIEKHFSKSLSSTTVGGK